MNLADTRRNGYPCSSNEFWWLVAEVERLQAIISQAADDLDTSGRSRFADDLRRAASPSPTEGP